MTTNGIAHICPERVDIVALRENRCAYRSGGEAAGRIFLDQKDNLIHGSILTPQR